MKVWSLFKAIAVLASSVLVSGRVLRGENEETNDVGVRELRHYETIALESLQFRGSYLDAGGDRKVWTAKKGYSHNGYRQWKLIHLYKSVFALESVKFPRSYLDAGGNRKVWTAEKELYNGYRKWKLIHIYEDVYALESLQFPGSYLDAGGDRKAWTAAKDYKRNGYRQWRIIPI